MYNLVSNEWIEITTSPMPPARMNACMDFTYPILQILGGENGNGYLSDFWSFNLEYNSFEQLESGSMPALTEHVCVLDSDYVFYTFGGRTSELSLNTNLYYYHVGWGDPVPLPYPLYISSAGLIFLEGFFAIIGGNQIDVALSNVTLYETATGIGYNMENLPVAVTSHAIAQAGKNIYVFGGSLSMGSSYQKEVGTSNFYLVNNDYFQCSKGFYSSSCTPCPPGSYSVALDSTSCELCPAGTYGSRYGLSYLSQCTPCSYGTFADQTGSTYCKDYHTPSECPIGSTAPIHRDSIQAFTEIQPSPYDDHTSVAANYISNFQIAVYVALILTGVLYGALLHTRAFRYIDLFKNEHEVERGQDPERTAIGGVATMIFLIASSIFIVSPSILYFIANITETKTLVPVFTLDNQIFTAELLFLNITLYNYGGNCGNSEGVCYNHVDAKSTGFSSQASHISCTRLENACLVSLQCYGCYVSTSGYATVTFNDYLVYATGIKIEVGSTSSIPDSNSSYVQFYLDPGQDKVFNGLQSSVVYVAMYPSVESI